MTTEYELVFKLSRYLLQRFYHRYTIAIRGHVVYNIHLVG